MVILGAFQVALGVKNPPANAGRSPGGEQGSSLQCSCLEHPMDRGACRATVHSVAQSRTRLKRLSTAHNVIFIQKFKLQSLSLTEMLSKASALYSQAHSVIFFLKKTPQITKTSTSQALESVS